MGHLGVTEALLVLGLLALIFGDVLVRRLGRWVARTKPTADAALEEQVLEEATELAPDDQRREPPSAGS